MKITITSKLRLAFGTVFILLVIIVGSGIGSMNRIHQATRKIVAEHVPVLTDIAHAESSMLKGRQEVGVYIATGEAEHLDHAAILHTEVEERLTTLQSKLRGKEERAILVSILATYAEYASSLDAAVDYYNENPTDLDGLLPKLYEADKYLEGAALAQFEQLYEIELARTQTLEQVTHNLFLSIRTMNIVLAVIGLIISGGATYIIGRGVTCSVTHLNEMVDSMSRGNLDTPIEVTTGDEVQVLAESIERMRVGLEAAIERLRRR